MAHARKAQAGFTLIELMITLAVVSVLSAFAGPMYLGYTKDAKMAEGKALAGAVYAALDGCAQMRSGKPPVCTLADAARRAGVSSATGTSGDGRWVVSVVPLAGLPQVSFMGVVGVVGVSGRDTDAIGIGLHARAAGNTLRCRSTANTVPGISAGDAC